MRQERIQFGPDLSKPLSLVPDLYLGLLKGLAEPCCFGHDRVRALDQGGVLDAHGDTYPPDYHP
ncbi:hypothetical protein Mnod_8063 (plasmid) [Methylobacterium nodulans ORS 2060]|uniref:Uncharacterized protein n=1 Tax=Methylobacterium nodulans (strain LMG 21967 / CNCM I-2342 / ORS 2060) TaxID=460265 RepID=B8IX12_METNO|nr:hypothetical protein Mnod_8063 [Methylobacterium nodulans ORS 2060]